MGLCLHANTASIELAAGHSYVSIMFSAALEQPLADLKKTFRGQQFSDSLHIDLNQLVLEKVS